MKCQGCGAEMFNNQLFCTNCGARNETTGEPAQPTERQNEPASYQTPLYRTPTEQPDQMPPYQGNYPQQKKGSFLPIIIIVGALVVLLVGGIATVAFIRQIIRNKEKTVVEHAYDIIDEFAEEYPDDVTIPEDTIIDTPSFDDDTVTDDPADTTDDYEYSLVFNYSELPAVASIDGDSRFQQYAYSPVPGGVTVYTYYFNDSSESDVNYVDALQNYCEVLSVWYSCGYEEAIAELMDDYTHQLCEYYSFGDTIIGITADYDRYVYISLFDRSYLDNQTDNTDTTVSDDYPNYNDYLYGRVKIAFEQYNLVMMENGINFYMNDIYLTDNGDGTARIDCTMDMKTNFYSSDLYSDDFMIVPLDKDGNVLADAAKIDAVTDSYGNSLSTPVVLTADYISYNLSFTVPSNTVDIYFYGVNIQLDEYSDFGASEAGPAYYIYITFQTR